MCVSKMPVSRLVMIISFSVILFVSCGGRKSSAPKEVEVNASGAIVPRGEVLFQEEFIYLDNWHPEGAVSGVSISEPGTMRLDCTGSKQGGVGCMSFCRKDFPDSICIEYDLYVEEKNGLVITFVAMQGLGGEDAITGVPAREGYFKDYIGEDASTRSYHVSLSRYGDDATHTGVSNWRRNPGLHLMGQGDDPCKEINKWYHVAIVKIGPTLQLQVDGKFASGFTDPDSLPDRIPSGGKVGFRAIGSKAIARISNFKVTSLL